MVDSYLSNSIERDEGSDIEHSVARIFWGRGYRESMASRSSASFNARYYIEKKMEDMEDKTSRSMGQHLPLGVIPLIDFFNKLILDKHI